MNQTLADLPSPAARLTANLQLTGAGGGHGLRFRTLQILGMNMLGRLARVDNSRARFADDLGASVAFGDARWAELRQLLRAQLTAHGMTVPELPEPASFVYTPREAIGLHDVGAVILTSGFRPEY